MRRSVARHLIFQLALLSLGILLGTRGGVAQPEPKAEPKEQKQEERNGEEQGQIVGFGAGSQERPPQAAQPAREERRAIEEVLQEQDTQKRLELALAFLEDFPESPYRGRAYATAAEAYRMKNKYAQAVEYGEHALEVSPQDAITMIIVADSLLEGARRTRDDYSERLIKAEEYAQRALELLPDLFAGMRRRPDVPEEEYLRQERYIEAQAHAVLGFAYLRRQEYERAEQELKQAIELVPERANPYDFLRLGFVHVRQQEWKEAREVFARCIESVGPQARNCQQQLERVEKILEQTAEVESPGSGE